MQKSSILTSLDISDFDTVWTWGQKLVIKKVSEKLKQKP